MQLEKCLKAYMASKHGVHWDVSS